MSKYIESLFKFCKGGAFVSPAALLVVLGAFPVSGNASVQGGNGISMIGERYSTELIIKHDPCDGYLGGCTQDTSQSTISNVPINNELSVVDAPRVYAKAEANYFSVATATSAFSNVSTQEYTKATAETMLSFRALHDAVVPLKFEFDGSGLSFYSDGFVSLYDQTSDESIFSYSWCCSFFQGTVPWEPRNSEDSNFPWFGYVNFSWGATIGLDQRLIASHEYDLTIHASTNANNDAQYMRVSVSGLNVPIMPSIPEPETYAMMLLGLGLLIFVTQRSRHNN